MMAERTWLDKTLHIWRVRLIGFGLILFGLSIILTPTGAFGVTTYIWQALGLSPSVQGLLMATSGCAILLFKLNLWLYLTCTVPMLLYAVASFFFVTTNHLAWTLLVGYSIIYGVMFLEGSNQA